MTVRIFRGLIIFAVFGFPGFSINAVAQEISIRNDAKLERVTFGNQTINLTLDYHHKANIALVTVNGQEVINSTSGIYSRIDTRQATLSSLSLSSSPKIKIENNVVTLTGINYGNKGTTISENWKFTVSKTKITLNISRFLPQKIVAEKVFLPMLEFKSIDTWEGAYQDYGGLAWFYLFNKKLDTYGVNSRSSKFWNSKTGTGLSLNIEAPSQQVAMDYSRTQDDKLECAISIASHEIFPRFDPGTNRRVFVRDTTRVWAPITLNAGTSSQTISISSFNFNEQYGRGNLKGINQEQVSAVLNTIARIGVIGKNRFGGNSWHTPYGPICLHEQYIAEMGLAINDSTYLNGYRQCLDDYRDNAIKPDGRVWPRWAYSNEDAMPNAFTNKGFYEAQWGYLLDANPDFVTNVAELYDQNGDLNWVRSHKSSCEKALDWIIKRDVNGNALVEMMTDSYKQKRSSDWIDIIWAAYENAFVNVKLYHALILWTDIEKQLGDFSKQKQYLSFAEKLKVNFNKSTKDGGFWDEEKKCYIHWRDKDGSIHGTNMVTPVNFMAIAYGICDDTARRNQILDDIEIQMQKEKLFFWPLCLYSYAPGEGNDWQFPFPNYENGDIFLSWGSVAVKAYASYKPELAVKYIKNVLAQYAKDGLAFQRYGRAKQDGLGDDILAGNGLSVVGLYHSVYGINPLHNRFYLDPHLTEELNGTTVKYNFRGQQLLIDLSMQNYSVSNNRFTIISKNNFGFYSVANDLFYFNGKDDTASLKAKSTSTGKLILAINSWGNEKMFWTQSLNSQEKSKVIYQLNKVDHNSYYDVFIDNKFSEKLKTTTAGTLSFTSAITNQPSEIMIKKSVK